jgi:invasion protein IalB
MENVRKVFQVIGFMVGCWASAMALPSAAHAQDGATTTFGDWQHKCEVYGGNKDERCYILYSAVMPDTNTRILQMAVAFEGPKQGPMAILTAPLGVQLEEGLLLQVDGGETIRLPFKICAPGGCIAPRPLSADNIAELKRGGKLLVGFYNTAGELVAVPVSLNGFTAAFEALQ